MSLNQTEEALIIVQRDDHNQVDVFFNFLSVELQKKKKKAEMLESQWHGEFSVSSSQDFPLKLVQ